MGAALADLDLGEGDGSFASTSLGIQSIPSAARGKLQRHCRVTLPEVETEAWATSGLRSPLVQGGVSGPKAPSIVVVGTEFTALEPANFAGFLAEVTRREVAHHAVPEGGSFAAISSYLTSRGFRETPPQVLVWENPIQNRLGHRGPQPMEELIAAAQDNCRLPLALNPAPTAGVLHADLSTLPAESREMLMLDSGNGGTEVSFRFADAMGGTWERHMLRHPDQVEQVTSGARRF